MEPKERTQEIRRLKDFIAEQESRKSELIGRQKELHKRLKDEFGVDTVEEAEVEHSRLCDELEKVRKELSKSSEELDKLIREMGE